jgi:Reverse transcriptase (RNA-dependent DNA polymerase)
VIADRVVQAALKLVLEPIFEADFQPVSYGVRPMRRAHDAIAEIHQFGTHAYRWVLDADVEACSDSIEHAALLDRVRARVKDKRVPGLVKAFLKAGVLTELGNVQDTMTGTPQDGIAPRSWPTSPWQCSTSTCTGHGSRAGRWRPPADVPDAAPKACRTGESSATQTISSCSCTAPTPTSKPWAMRSLGCLLLWALHERLRHGCLCHTRGRANEGPAVSPKGRP